MHGYVRKHVKMHIKPTSGTNKHGKHIIARRRKGGKGMHEATYIMVMHPKWLHLNRALWVSDVTTTTCPLSASSVAKPRTREANTSIKHRSKKT